MAHHQTVEVQSVNRSNAVKCWPVLCGLTILTTVFLGARATAQQAFSIRALIENSRLSQSLGSTIIYVDFNASGANDGSSWTNAFNTVTGVKDALDFAMITPTVAEIWVAAGTYKPAGPGGDRSATHQLVNSVSVYGGFAGGETDLEQRDVFANSVILSGDLNGDDGPNFANRGDNSLNVVTASGTDSTARLDGGIYVVGGNANGNGPTPNEKRGGGCYNDGGDAYFFRVNFQDNQAQEMGGNVYQSNDADVTYEFCQFKSGVADLGGGMAIDGAQASAFYYYSTIENNDAVTNGGGLYVNLGSAAADGALVLTNDALGGLGGGLYFVGAAPTTWSNCNIDGNTAVNEGGGVRLAGGSNITFNLCGFDSNDSEVGGAVASIGSDPTFTICTFNANTARFGGAIDWDTPGLMTIQDSVFTNNVANDFVSAAAGAVRGSGDGVIENCDFIQNSTNGHGGAIQFKGSGFELRISDSLFADNSASGTTGGGAIANSTGCALRLANSRFTGNTAFRGGAVNNNGTLDAVNCAFSGNVATNLNGGALNQDSGDSDIVNCTVVGNSATMAVGGGLATNGGVFNIRNSILWNNEDNSGQTESAQLFAGGGSVDVDYSLIQNLSLWTAPLIYVGNIGSDPQLVDADGADDMIGTNDDDLRLRPVSPCIDAGDTTALPVDIDDADGDLNTSERFPFDYLQGLRIVDDPNTANTGVAEAGVVDIGAHEFQARTVLYVDAWAEGANDGSSWVDAYLRLQNALSHAANSGGEVQEIWVASRVYAPDEGSNVNSGDRSASFQLIDGVAIYGGFAGNETMLSERDPVGHVTILSGDLSNNDEPGFTNNDENSYHVVTSSGVNSSAILDGFTITGGNANGSSMDAFGGGIYNDGGTPSISQCVIQSNRADTAGGGMYNGNGGNATLYNVTFSGNDATITGGGMDSFNSAVLLEECDFIGNTATLAGAMRNTGSSPICERCEFSNNTADNAGGAVYNSGGSPEFRNCRFINNNTTGDGGGMLNETSDATVVECMFEGNDSGFSGGGIYNDVGSSTQLFNSRFSDNSAPYGGAGLYNTGTLQAVNCLFHNNSGGAIYNDIASPQFINCTITQNESITAPGIWSDGGTPFVRNCIIRECDKGGCNQEAALFGSFDVSYSNILGLDGSLGGDGNIDADPLFVSPIDGDYRIQAGSPAIDAGSVPSVPNDSVDLDQDSSTIEGVPFGLDGAARYYDDPDTTNTGEGDKDYPRVDIGAFEFLGVDCNSNNIPDNCDINCGMENRACDVPGCGESSDADMDGVPDECGIFSGDCPMMSDNWSCFDNWSLPGDVYPDNMGEDTFDVTLDNVDDVFLDVDVVIDSLVIKDQAKLRMTQTGSEGDLTISTDLGLKLMGTGPMSTQLLTAGNRMINLTCGPVTVLNAFYGPSPTAPPGSVNSILNCETLRITQPSGEVHIEDSMSINASVDLIVDGRGATPCTSDGGKTTPIKRVFDNGSVNIGGNFTLDGNTDFNNASAVNMNVGGSFFNAGQLGDCFDCSQGGISLIGSGTQTFEVSGEDLGASMNGFVHPMGHTNFSWEDIEVTGGASHVVRFLSERYNGFGGDPCTEALYVRNLTLQSGATITIDDVKVYYLNLVNNGATINTVGCGQLVPVQIPCTTNQQCDDSAACTFDDCHMGFCRFTEVEYGNVNGMGPPSPNLDDILCVLSGFANINNCTNGDIRGVGDAACVPNNIISLDDILAVLGAFSGVDLCGCVP